MSAAISSTTSTQQNQNFSQNSTYSPILQNEIGGHLKYHGSHITSALEIEAWFQLVFSVLMLLLQFPTLPIFLVYSEFRYNSCYIALSDFLQLFSIFLFTAFQVGRYHFSTGMERFWSAIYIIAWDHLIVQHFILSLNRLIIIAKAHYSPGANLSGDESRTENRIFNSLLAVSWLVLFLLIALFMTPFCGGIWDASALGFYYDMKLPSSDIYRQWEFYFTSLFPIVSICFYLAIMVLLVKTRKITQSLAPQQQQHQNQNKNNILDSLKAKEKRVLVQCIFTFAVLIALIVCWYIDYTTPPWTMLFLGYIFLNTTSLICINIEFRRRYIALYASVWRLLKGQKWELKVKKSSNAAAPVVVIKNPVVIAKSTANNMLNTAIPNANSSVY